MTTRWAKVGNASVAYRVMGDGPPDILYLMGEYLPVDALDEEPRYARALRRLASIGRVIAFNRRGVGLSDPPAEPLSHQQTVEDALAVIDDLASDRVVLFAGNVGGAAAIEFAAQQRHRTAALVLVNTNARYIYADDYAIGVKLEEFTEIADRTTSTTPVEFDFLTAFAPSVANDTRFREWWDQAGHRGASPARSRELWNLLVSTDVRHRLPQIEAPTLLLQRAGNIPEYAEYMADHIRGARYVPLDGADLMWWLGDANAVLDEIESFLATTGTQRPTRRRLATLLFIDVVASTERAASLGDERWQELLATYHELATRELNRSGGSEVSTSGDGLLATFDAPADAVRCALRIRDGVGALGLETRAGVHTGEIEFLPDDVAGIGVHIAARVMSAAHPGEVLVSRTVCDLVIGSGLAFESRGAHELKGVPGVWELYALSS